MKNLTPKRAALIIVRDWLHGSKMYPLGMDEDEMTYALDQYGYKVTEKRRELIIEQVIKIVEPFRDKVGDKISKFAEV